MWCWRKSGPFVRDEPGKGEGRLESILQFMFIGISLGCIYGMVGLQLVIVHNVSGVVNIATGEYVMLGAQLTYLFVRVLGLSYGLTAILVVLIPSLVSAVFVYGSIVNPLASKGRPGIIVILGTFAAAAIISAVVGVLSDFQRVGVPPITPAFLVGRKVGMLTVVPQYSLCIAYAALIIGSYWLFVNRTAIGRAFRATGINESMCQLLGVSSQKMRTLGFALVGAIGGMSGLLIGPMVTVDFAMGFPIMINGFIAAVIGGLDNPYGAVVGGCILGVATVMVGAYLAPGYAWLFSFLLLIVVLNVRPYGLFVERGTRV
jgi:branched-chain amino acid transport system permease protein